MPESLKTTPLNRFHRENGGRMVPFAGWDMPVQYTGILDEHKSVRTKMGLFDVSHMGEITVEGSEAKSFLNQLITNDINSLVNGKAIYSLICYSDGGVVDDVIIYQLNDDSFLICVNASNIEKDFEWITGKGIDFDCKIENRSNDYGQIAVQGPLAIDFLEKHTGLELSQITRFHFEIRSFMGIDCIFSRTGYTGEDGFEIYAPAESIEVITESIYTAGKDQGLSLAGLGCRDSLRLEAGYPLYGHEIDTTIDPISAGLGWAIKFNKETDFVGRESLLKKKVDQPEKQVRYFCLSDRRIARSGDPIINENDEEVGKVLSGSMSPLLNLAIGSALIDSNALSSQSILSASLRGKKYPLNIKKPPLHLSKSN